MIRQKRFIYVGIVSAMLSVTTPDLSAAETCTFNGRNFDSRSCPKGLHWNSVTAAGWGDLLDRFQNFCLVWILYTTTPEDIEPSLKNNRIPLNQSTVNLQICAQKRRKLSKIIRRSENAGRGQGRYGYRHHHIIPTGSYVIIGRYYFWISLILLKRQ